MDSITRLSEMNPSNRLTICWRSRQYRAGQRHHPTQSDNSSQSHNDVQIGSAGDGLQCQGVTPDGDVGRTDQRFPADFENAITTSMVYNLRTYEVQEEISEKWGVWVMYIPRYTPFFGLSRLKCVIPNRALC